MALIGGGGAGNVAGANPSGIGSGINYIGKHAYGYSGEITADTNATKLLEFDTGNTYLVAKFQPVYFTEAASTNAFWQILFDNQEIYQIEVTGATNGTPFQELEIIIPAFTKVKITCNAASSTLGLGAVLTGEVYA